MPDETAEQKAAREAEEARDARLVERIALGTAKGLEPVIAKLAEREHSAPVTRSEPVSIVRPTEEQIAQAQIDGNAAELARLLKLQRAADKEENRRDLAQLASQGGSAISSVSQRAAESDPAYKRYKKEVDAEIEKFKALNPQQIITPEHYAIATKIVRADHVDDEINERIEESRRQAREKEEALLPENQHHEEERVEKEPTNLAELLATGNWKKEFREKSGRVGGRTDDEELRKMGYKNGLPEYAAQRRNMEKLEDDLGSGMGLDRDWVWTDKAKGEGHYIN